MTDAERELARVRHRLVVDLVRALILGVVGLACGWLAGRLLP